MSQVANINGKKVFSDKQVASIINTRVTFTDGSWCDVATGEVVNKGQGFINIGSSAEESGEKITVGPKTFSANALEVRDIIADLDVQVHQANTIEVIIVGPANEVKNIHIKQEGNTVVVEGEDGEASGADVTIISGRGGSFTRVGRISGSGVVIGGSIRGTSIISGDVVFGRNVIISGGGENLTKVTVKVPKGASLNLSDIEGKTRLGDTEGSLRLHIGGGGDVNVGKVQKVNAKISGSGRVAISSIQGNAKLRVSGSGDFSVAGGDIGELEADVSGSGDINIRATVQEADLSVSGSGDIYVFKVVNRPQKHLSGSGSIRVGNW
ncbi:hypothetical protein A2962_00780 [Candidatus Woesebacteria bacterium RIFCSPLOWO2_01_FULL_39_61]|uniref:Putative auto-transporter adhesin head GIN domain-containing protein n=1 Tax=Candidatus Woesebacteria bacterium RIFCSPHIGHO2_02_FULL_39_13 TaxID=1802505 RepID=A0A1F7Z4N6_9BACT|nr:MAG: hypothetical protein A2692_02975 [Candidatus Woesebacteria bacterium RIFCSPHIGHO2_01_FULL_39_95]OGM34411.1 MAG: hypothetical protein A3D01_05560 [Candidatus Woesebacteria bacterium RIFCSPHIGHO2_02_FULL_39_13]OGM36228.1 MAG: hypothetical protein A3E13_02720 [Candidatus Woesebacteria bacterium RIFCSPHIGHO2_12_FULL_40_20]OGM68276.1 MAG: hypothetical protein A2962_00780 [Candidatus Woesebacteria bacterium RIFCSPLOWO2_01_FULL_39_61]OGM74867.1 MAG: hypothetical protein A3H19_03825 [Candidatus